MRSMLSIISVSVAETYKQRKKLNQKIKTKYLEETLREIEELIKILE